MIRLKIKLAIFNLLSKLVFAALFLLFLPYIIERINLRQVDKDLIQKREQVIGLISEIGLEPFITSDSSETFGSYNILKEEFISLEKVDLADDWNFIEVTTRLIEDEEIEYRVLNYSFTADGQMYLLEVGKSLTSIIQAKKNITSVIILFLLLIIILTLLTDLQYTRMVLKPLDSITGKLKGISSPAIFDKTPVKTSTADFHDLDEALRELMAHIDGLFQKEKEITVNISHELLTPVSVLRSKLENMLLQRDVDQDISAKIEESLKTLHRLQSLVNSLLLIARIESQQYLREESFSLKEVLGEIISEISPIAEDKGVQLEGDLFNDFLFPRANRSLVFSMLYNVINNGVKNTGRGGRVKVITGFREKKFTVTVEDTGSGMTEAQLKTLFSRFRTRTGNNDNGTGIGLAIAKSIADLHNIEVSVRSEINTGTNFLFIFP